MHTYAHAHTHTHIHTHTHTQTYAHTLACTPHKLNKRSVCMHTYAYMYKDKKKERK